MTHSPLRLATPADAEEAFYQAIRLADIDAMMAVWCEDEEIVCTHPGGARLVGHDLIRAGWQALFQSGIRLHIELSQQITWHNALMSVHNVVETIRPEDGSPPQAPLVATNVFSFGKQGWRLLSHHASLSAGLPLTQALSESLSKRVLH